MTTPDTATPTTNPRTGLRTRTKLIISAVVLVPILLFAFYAWTALHWSYSEGYRAGVLQKFSHKGWLCKTGEGELAQAVIAGVSPTIWKFTVRDDAVGTQVDAVVGKKVRLHYREHRGVPTNCFGETSYFVDSVAVVE